MALQGNLRDMAVADLIQQYGQDEKTAVLHITHGNEEAILYFHEGTVAHAELGDQDGEEVVYHALGWEDGAFSLEMDVSPPTISITRSWSGLLLEGARRLDEADQEAEILAAEKEMEEKIAAQEAADKKAAAAKVAQKPKVKKMARKRKSDMLADVLSELLQESADIVGAGVVGTDGLVYSANVPFKGMEEDMVGAAAAAAFGLSKRGVNQLHRGDFTRTLIQGTDGNIIIVGLNPETLLIVLTPDAINLGMAFAEVRDAVGQLQEIL